MTASSSPRWLASEAPLRLAFYSLLAVYLQTVTFDFVYDDHTAILLNPWLDSWSGLKNIFGSHLWGFSDAFIPARHYRPMYLAWLWLVRHLFGPAPGWFHLFALLAHLLAVYLAYRLARALLHDDLAAAIAAALFAIHPTKVESVAWITAATEPLQALFVFGALLTYLRSRDSQHRAAPWTLASFLLCLAALMTKETAVVLPAILVALEVWMPAQGRRPSAVAIAKTAAPATLAVVVFFLVRLRVLHGFGEWVVPGSMADVLLTVPAAFWLYVRQILWPVRLSILYPITVVDHFSTAHVLLPALAFLALALLYWRWARRSPILKFAAAWFLLTVFPVLGEFQWVQLHDRHLYLPSFAVALMLAEAVRQIRWPVQVRAESAQTALAMLLVLVMAVLSAREVRVWDSDLSVFARAVQVAPSNLEAVDQLAEAQFYGGQKQRALATLRHGLQLAPNSDRLTFSLGSYYYQMHEYEQARPYLEQVVTMKTDSGRRATALFALSSIDLQQQDFDAAARRLRAAIALAPSVAGYRRTLQQLHRSQALRFSSRTTSTR
jgi:Tfp pilus assembly protein PilF